MRGFGLRWLFFVLGAVVLAGSLTGIGVLLFYARTDERLIAAIERADVQAVTREIARGADVNRARQVVYPPLKDYGLDGATETGVTPLHDAATCGEARIVELLVEAGADPDAASGPLGWTPLLRAVILGDPNTVRALVEAGANVDRRGSSGGPLHHAARQGKAEVVRILLNAGANLGAPGYDGKTPLMLAVWWYADKGDGPLRATQLMLERGADIRARDDKGRTALMYAARYGNADIVRRLLEADAEIETTDTAGRTALMYAAEDGQADVVELLLARGASVHLQDQAGQTAADIARSAEYGDRARTLDLLKAAMGSK